MKKSCFLISMLLFIIGGNVLAATYTIEAENMAGSGASVISSPFNGLRFYSNNNSGTASQVFADGAGVYRISITGASSNASTAGISLYVDGVKKKAFSFTGTTAATITADVKLPDLSTTNPTSVVLKLETDNGSNDTDIDKIVIEYTGLIVVKSPPTLPAQGAFYTDTYRNMFLEAGYSQSAIDAKLGNIWQQFFYGGDNQKLYYPVGTDEAYILDVHNNDVRSEGMSYGMMICVQMNKQTEFNRLWKWAKTHMQYTSGQYEGYFAWQMNTNGSIKGNGPASDGEEYFVMALMFAAHRWGNGAGIYNYELEANDILYHCMKRGDTGGGVVNLFNSTQKQVVFVPYGNAASFTDPSYHLPAFYQLWSLWATDTSKRPFWAEVAQKSRDMWPSFAHASTGLMPDYAEFSGAPHNGDGDHKGFYYDAWRCTMNMAMDYAWFNNTGNTLADEQTIINRIHTFFETKGIDSYGSLYNLDGSVYQNNADHSPGLVACNATGTLASNQSIAWDFVDDFFNMYIPSGQYRYYDGMLYFMNYLHLSGNFKIYKPIPDESNATLQSLSTSVGTLKPAFSSGVTNYEVKVANSVENINIDFSTTNPGATATVVKTSPVEALPDLRNSGSDNFPLAVGDNVFEIEVKSSNQNNTIVYTLTVIRASEDEGDDGDGDGDGGSSGGGGGDDCNIVFDFETTPDENILAYSIMKYASDAVAAGTCVIGDAAGNTVTPTNNHAVHTTGTGSYGEGGALKLQFTLPAGKTLADYDNKISFDIYFPTYASEGGDQGNGTKNILYGINLPPKDQSSLISISSDTDRNKWITKEIPLGSLPSSTNSFYVSIGCNWGAAHFYVDNVFLIAKPESCAPADPQTDATLSALSVNEGTLTPVFSKSTTAYTVSVANDIESITIAATASQEGTGSSDVDGDGPKTLQVGANTFEVIVTAPNGSTHKTYTIVVTRADENVSCDIVFDFETAPDANLLTYSVRKYNDATPNASSKAEITTQATTENVNNKAILFTNGGSYEDGYGKLVITLPAGKTLADYDPNLKFDIYVPTTGGTDNKNIRYTVNSVFSSSSSGGTELLKTTSANPAGNCGIWLARTISLASLPNSTTSFYILIGDNWSNGPRFYIDNIKLVAKEGTCPRTYTWAPTASSTNWTSAGNWLPNGIPGASDKVIIPQSSSYPSVPASTTVKSITFRPGAEIGDQHNLTGDYKAFVQLDFSAPSTRNRWWMLASPLQELYAGDLSFGGLPGTDVRVFSADGNEAHWVGYEADQLAQRYAQKFEAGGGFLLYLSNNDDAAKGLGKANGIVELPFFDNPKVNPAVHYTHEYAGGTSTIYGRNASFEKTTDVITTLARTAAANKLAGGTVNETLAFGHNDLRQSDFAFAGNPFMTTIDFAPVASTNSAIIKDNYQIWTGSGYSGYNLSVGAEWGLVVGLTQHIAPLQGFIVEKAASYTAGSMAFNIADAATGSATLRSSERPLNTLEITAQQSDVSVRTLIASRENGSNAFGNADSRKLFSSISAVPDVYTLKPTTEGNTVAVGVNVLGRIVEETLIPIGLSTSYDGSMSLKFAGMNEYEAVITLYDAAENRTVDLTGMATYEYPFVYHPAQNAGKVVASETRFFITLSPANTTVAGNSLSGKILIYSDSRNSVHIVSSAPIQEVTVYNAQGAAVYSNPSVNSSNHVVEGLSAGVYLVKAVSGNDAKVVKLGIN
ncbi:MAG: cadherin-like beta sandwich domain-containing protein [Bacteroidales bacterium]|nr:cadherin-like beta sandwich domain-containing protein [Bacteroidales bacterium]